MAGAAGDAMADCIEAAEFLDIDVDQFARPLPLVPPHRRGRFQIAQPTETQALQDAADGGRRDAELGGDRLAGPALPPQVPDPRHHRRRCRPAQAMRPRRAVLEPGLPFQAPARHPLAHGLDAKPEGRGHGLRALPLLDHATHQFGSTTRRQAGILVDVHSILRET